MESMGNKVLIVAGEASGDKYAANIAQELKKRKPDYEIAAIGGKHVREINAFIIEDIENLTVVGLTEVLKHIPQVLQTLKKVKNFLKHEKPDFVILIDYPDFNFRVAKYAFEENIPVFYFVSPQIWAWRRGRVKFLKKYVKKLFVIFPFEVSFYRNFNMDVEFVGHPLCEKIKKLKSDKLPLKKRFAISLLPGSRNSEIHRLLHVMLKASLLIKERYPETDFFLPVARSLDFSKIEEIVKTTAPFVKVVSESHTAINMSHLVISASGTATLESALFGKPVIIVYKVAPISYMLGRLLIKVPYIGMPNLLLGKLYNPELIQGKVTYENIFKETVKFFENRLKYELTVSKNSLLLDKLYRENTFSTTVDNILKQLK